MTMGGKGWVGSMARIWQEGADCRAGAQMEAGPGSTDSWWPAAVWHERQAAEADGQGS